MRHRRDIKKAWFVMQLMLASSTNLNDNERNMVLKTKVKFEKKLNEVDETKENSEVINRRREYLSHNSELAAIFSMYWNVMRYYEDPEKNVITEDGYIKFNIFIQHAVIGGGNLNLQKSINLAKNDYLNDTASYGPLTKECFYDILLEIIEMWTENGVAKLLTSFAWALLNSVFDINSYPPRFRSLKQVKCISANDESELLSLFSKSLQQRAQMKVRLEWLERMNLSHESYSRLISRRNSVLINQGAHDMIMITAAHRQRNVMNDDVEEEEEHNAAIAHYSQARSSLYHCQSMAATFDDGDGNDNDDDDGVYYTNHGYDPLSPRFDPFDNAPLSDSFNPPPLIHTNTIIRLCPDIETTIVTHTIGAAGSMKIASKLFNIAADARKTLLQSSSFQQLKSVEEDTISTTNLSSPSVMKWLKKVSYLVSALSSMESSDQTPSFSNSHPPSQSFPSKRYESYLAQLTEKPQTPLSLNHLESNNSNEYLAQNGRYHLDKPDPLIQLFTINERLPNLHLQEKNKLYLRGAQATISRRKQKGPHIIKGEPGQAKGYKLDEGEEEDEGGLSSQSAKGLETKSLLSTRSNFTTSIRKKEKIKRNPIQKYENGDNDDHLEKQNQPSSGQYHNKITNRSLQTLRSHYRESPISDSIISSDEESDTKKIKWKYSESSIPSRSISPNSTNHQAGAGAGDVVLESEAENDPDGMFIHDTNPINNEIDCFEEEFELYSKNQQQEKDLNQDSLNVSKLISHSHSHHSSDQQDFISVDIVRPTSKASNLQVTSFGFVSNPSGDGEKRDNRSNGRPPIQQRSITSASSVERGGGGGRGGSQNIIHQFPRNQFAVVDTRHFSADSSRPRGNNSSEYRLAQHVSYNPDSSLCQSTNTNLNSTSPSFYSSSSPSSSSQRNLSRPITTGSLAMDQFYSKQYSDQLTSNSLTDAIGTSIQPNHLELPVHRSHSAQRYRQLRSPPTSELKSKKSSRNFSSPSLPNPSKSSQHQQHLHNNNQTERIFLNSGREKQQTASRTVSPSPSLPPHSSHPSHSSHPHSRQLNSNISSEDSLHLSYGPAVSPSERSHLPHPSSDSCTAPSKKSHFMESTGHLRPETYKGVKRSLQIVTYYTENNYR